MALPDTVHVNTSILVLTGGTFLVYFYCCILDTTPCVIFQTLSQAHQALLVQ